MPRIVRRRSPGPRGAAASGRRTSLDASDRAARRRLAARLTQRQVAERVGVSQSRAEPARAWARRRHGDRRLGGMRSRARSPARGVLRAGRGREPAAGHRAPAAAEPRSCRVRAGGGGRAIPEASVDPRARGRGRSTSSSSARRGARLPSSRSGTCCSTAGRRCGASSRRSRHSASGSGPAGRPGAARRARHAPEPRARAGAAATVRGAVPGVLRGVAQSTDRSRDADAERRRLRLDERRWQPAGRGARSERRLAAATAHATLGAWSKRRTERRRARRASGRASRSGCCRSSTR